MAGEIFHALAERAQKAGASLVQFEVNLGRFIAGPQPGTGMNHSWCCRSAGKSKEKGSNEDEEIMVRFGRTGEEAFRSCVEAMEKR
jgi:hypothetical protein